MVAVFTMRNETMEATWAATTLPLLAAWAYWVFTPFFHSTAMQLTFSHIRTTWDSNMWVNTGLKVQFTQFPKVYFLEWMTIAIKVTRCFTIKEPLWRSLSLCAFLPYTSPGASPHLHSSDNQEWQIESSSSRCSLMSGWFGQPWSPESFNRKATMNTLRA